MGEVSNCIQSAAGIQKTATLRNESVEVSRDKFCYRSSCSRPSRRTAAVVATCF